MILSVIAKGLYRALSGPDSDEVATDGNSRGILSLFVAGVGGQISDGDQGIHCGCCAPSVLRLHWPLAPLPVYGPA